MFLKKADWACDVTGAAGHVLANAGLRTVHGHLVDLGGVVLLDVPQDPDVVVLHKVDGHTLAAVTTRAANPARGREVKGHLEVKQNEAELKTID